VKQYQELTIEEARALVDLNIPIQIKYGGHWFPYHDEFKWWKHADKKQYRVEVE
jgi:hypothetical protein